MNLVVHSDGGALTIRADEGEIQVIAKDQGPGIAPEHIPHLTERFYRVDKGRSRQSGGTGLGLAIVKHALAEHNSLLKINSKLGEGSEFSAVFKQIVPPARR